MVLKRGGHGGGTGGRRGRGTGPLQSSGLLNPALEATHAGATADGRRRGGATTDGRNDERGDDGGRNDGGPRWAKGGATEGARWVGRYLSDSFEEPLALRLMSSALTLWVRAPKEMKSTPALA